METEMKKVLVGAAILFVMAIAVVYGATGAMEQAGANSPGQPILTFGSTSVTLVIPTPNCRDAGCTWELALQTGPPKGPFVASIFGTTGTLEIQYPAYCGTIQADVLVGTPGGVFHKDFGHRTEIATCPPTTTTQPPTTSTSAPVTTTTQAPEVPAPPATLPPPSSGGPGPTVTPPASSAVAPSPSGATAPMVAAAATPSAQLPRTGSSVWHLAAIGAVLVGLGGLLMRRRRVA